MGVQSQEWEPNVQTLNVVPPRNSPLSEIDGFGLGWAICLIWAIGAVEGFVTALVTRVTAPCYACLCAASSLVTGSCKNKNIYYYHCIYPRFTFEMHSAITYLAPLESLHPKTQALPHSEKARKRKLKLDQSKKWTVGRHLETTVP